MVLSTTALFSQFQQGAYGSADPSFPTVDPPKVWTTERALGVNKDPGAYKGLQPYYLYQWDYPALLVHSHVSTVDASMGMKALLRLQTGSYYDTYENHFGEAIIQFWSNEYSFGNAGSLNASPYQWHVGQIKSICNKEPGVAITDITENLKGGLAFYNSFGENVTDAQIEEPLEVLRLIDGKAGIRMSGTELPELPLDVRGYVSSGSFDHYDQMFVDGGFRAVSSDGYRTWFANLSDWGPTIAFGSRQIPGYHFDPDDMPAGCSGQPPQGDNTAMNFWLWGRSTGIGCNPRQQQGASGNTEYRFYHDPGGNNDSFGAGELFLLGPKLGGAKCIISDERYPYWANETEGWELFPGHHRVLRVERRNSGTTGTDAYTDPEFVNYKLISAGHEDNETFIVNANGLVEIKGSSNNINLKVEGTQYVEELFVKLKANWPDYVFDSGYELMPLENLEKEIEVQGHLPDMPSADEVEKNGINIAEVQTKMLKKIEELTLYVIELKKENERIKAQLNNNK